MSLPLEVELTTPNGITYKQPTGLFINNEFVKSKSGRTFETINPTNEEPIASVYEGDAEDIDIAVKAARAALDSPEWSEITTEKRGRLLYKLADLIEENIDLLASIDTWDNGKPFTVARDVDVAGVVSCLRYYAGWSDKIYGKTIDVDSKKLAYTLHQPIGVCAQIIPWNYPLLMLAWKLGPALCTGNTIVLKTAEQTPLSALVIGRLAKEAGYPPGVLNIISGFGRTAGAHLAAHEGVDKVAFTGSTATGRIVMKAASSNLKNITLETGGKSPAIIFDDCDLEQTVKWAHAGIMGNMGQVCCATSRLYVQDTIYEKFLPLFRAQTEKISVVGDPFEKNTFQGPQITKVQFDKILGYVESGKKEGATLVCGGQRTGDKGFFIEPTIFTDVKDDMTISKEEVFGPFVVISTFKTAEEAVKRANDTTYGLGASVFTRDLQRAHKVAAKLESGMVWVNSSGDSHHQIPFGGVKQSGIGRELGDYALQSYTQVKAVHVNLGSTM